MTKFFPEYPRLSETKERDFTRSPDGQQPLIPEAAEQRPFSMQGTDAQHQPSRCSQNRKQRQKLELLSDFFMIANFHYRMFTLAFIPKVPKVPKSQGVELVYTIIDNQELISFLSFYIPGGAIGTLGLLGLSTHDAPKSPHLKN